MKNQTDTTRIIQIETTLSTKNGQFLALDEHNNPLTLEWELIPGNAPRLTEKIRELSDIFVKTYTQQELEFARACPDEVQGAIQFFVTAQEPHGSIKAAMFGVLPGTYLGQKKQLEKLLMSSIFRLLPETSRLFLHTRKTAIQTIGMYREWGFTPFAGPLEKWLDLEYLADRSIGLQDLAKTIG